MAIFLDLEFFSHLITSSFLEGSVSAEKLKNKVNYIYISIAENLSKTRIQLLGKWSRRIISKKEKKGQVTFSWS